MCSHSGSQAQCSTRNRGLLVALLHVLAVSGLAEAPLSDWQNLSKIVPGRVVEVWRSPADKVSWRTVDKVSWRSGVVGVAGKFVRFSDNDLTLDVEGREITFAKPTVLYVVLKGSDGRSTLVGAAAGAAAGAALAGAPRDTHAGNAAAGGAVAGTAIGAAIGGGLTVEKIIYKADRRKRNPKSQPAGAPGSKR